MQSNHLVLINFETLVELGEWLQRLVNGRITGSIGYFYVESDWHEVKGILLMKIAELLHYQQ